MGQITSQLGQLFAQTIPTVIFVFFLMLFLDRLFFRPLSRTLDARAEATSGALAEARKQAAAAEEKLSQYEHALQKARQEIYRLREAARRDALKEREDKIQKSRAAAESMLKEAQGTLAMEVMKSKIELRLTVESLAAEVTEALLAPGLDKGGQRGTEV
ncbi:MAG: ATP synthase F0 subunit B [Acidobacteria bacterium]|nr:ATP synthase F0 subunit B [Acidobacteriota bacterium]